MNSAESLQFELHTIRDATNNFSNDNLLGCGGFGSVYMGKLTDEQEIAVKRLAENSGHGDIEFKNEVQLLAKLQHGNLVKLLGFCLQANFLGQMILSVQIWTGTCDTESLGALFVGFIIFMKVLDFELYFGI